MFDQRIDAVKFSLAAQKRTKFDINGFAVEISLEIKHENFEQRRAIIESGASAITCDAGMNNTVNSEADRINPVLELAVRR